MAKNPMRILTNGIIKENPVLRLILGTCPTLAVTTMAENGIWMGVVTTFVLVGSNIAISLLRKVIPERVRLPAFVTVIAGFVTLLQMFVSAYIPDVNDKLGIYMPLIVVNCFLFARAEMFASKNKVVVSALDGLGMGIGFTAALVLMGIIREFLGNGTIFGISLIGNLFDPVLIFIMPPGGFFVFGILIMLANKLSAKTEKPRESACVSCPAAAACPGLEAGPVKGGEQE